MAGNERCRGAGMILSTNPSSAVNHMSTESGVQVTDTLLPDQLKAALIETVSWMPMYFINRRERYSSHELDMHWYYPMAVTDQPDTDDVEPALRALDEQFKPVVDCWDCIKASYHHPVRLYECMLSANAFGTEGHPHHDVNNPPARLHHHTALVYCNQEWNVNWGGETLVFDEHHEIVAAVMPKPGRVMKISGDPLHVGRSVSRICPTDRRVLAFKYWGMEL
jgi:SM-20-related protein